MARHGPPHGIARNEEIDDVVNLGAIELAPASQIRRQVNLHHVPRLRSVRSSGPEQSDHLRIPLEFHYGVLQRVEGILTRLSSLHE